MFQVRAVEKIKAHVSKPFVENLAVYGIMWKNTAEQDGRNMTIWCMRIACWVPKATNTHQNM